MAPRKNNCSGSPANQVSKNTAKYRLETFQEIFEKEDNVLVVINADPDAIACAMAIKRILRYKVSSVAIAHPNEIRRVNNVTMVERLKVPLLKLKAVDVGEYNKVVMVDSQPNHLPTFANLEVAAIIDHHPPPADGWPDVPFVDIRPEYGACSTMLVEYLRAGNMKPSVALATALFYGIKVDTQNFENKSLLADGICFRYLFDIANRNLVRKFELADLRRSELKYIRIALASVKYSKGRYYCHIGRVPSPDVLVIVADFLNHVGEIDWVFVSGIHNEKLVVIFRCDGYRKSAGKLATKTFGELGSAGGHKEAARAEVPLKNLSLGDKEFTSDTLKRLILRYI
ncbi:MAG: DHH family phosphoesterase [Desulfotalea sp.]